MMGLVDILWCLDFACHVDVVDDSFWLNTIVSMTIWNSWHTHTHTHKLDNWLSNKLKNRLYLIYEWKMETR
jgi:hypothetical protein